MMRSWCTACDLPLQGVEHFDGRECGACQRKTISEAMLIERVMTASRGTDPGSADVAFFDGACEPRNPGGHLGMGWLVMDRQQLALLSASHAYEPEGPATSSNVAEYLAAAGALQAYLNLRRPGPVVIHGDSQLVIKQITGEWQVRGGLYVVALRKLRELCDEATAREIRIAWRWVGRDLNTAADFLSKLALSQHGVEARDWKAGRR